MNTSFDRLLNLAQKTGGNLIIYDRYSDCNLVVLGVDEYERLVDVDMDKDRGEYCGGEDTREMSEGEMLDKINRDIAAWRSYQEKEDYENREEMLEEELASDPFDPFSEDYSHNDEWHSAGEILHEKHPGFSSSEFASGLTFPARSLFSEKEDDDHQPVGFTDFHKPLAGGHVPYQEHDDGVESDAEPLEDEPIFFEEPVE